MQQIHPIKENNELECGKQYLWPRIKTKMKTMIRKANNNIQFQWILQTRNIVTWDSQLYAIKFKFLTNPIKLKPSNIEIKLWVHFKPFGWNFEAHLVKMLHVDYIVYVRLLFNLSKSLTNWHTWVTFDKSPYISTKVNQLGF